MKAVLDRQPLLGTGPLPEWLRNLEHGRAMIALDTFQDNLCVWRCIAVHQGSRPDRSTQVARGFAASFYKLTTAPNNVPRTSLDELDLIERHFNQGTFSRIGSVSEFMSLSVRKVGKWYGISDGTHRTS